MNHWLEQHRTLVLSMIGILILISVIIVGLRWQQPSPIVIEPPAATATSGPIQVYISGAVAQPDVYSVPSGAIVRDALALAGGPASDADLNAINLAQTLRPGDQVYVPHIGEVAPPVVSAGENSENPSSAPSGPININTATQAELETLPGIGPALATRIIDYREANGPFATIEAIQNVSGIGPATFENLKELITVN
jgi:competence protein ComEA